MSEGKRYRMRITRDVHSVATAEINARNDDEAEAKILNLTREDPTWLKWREVETTINSDDSPRVLER